jgi:uncharacterized membrane protein
MPIRCRYGDTMKHLAIAVCISFIAFGWSTRVHAGLNICNESGQPIYVAIAWEENNDWHSRGWFNINSLSCATPISGTLQSRYYWYYAESLEKKLIWAGNGATHSGAFCVITDAFFFRDSNRTDCDYRDFKRIDTGDTVVYTLSLTESRKDPEQAAMDCRDQIAAGQNAFIYCWTRAVATSKQRAILDCWNRAQSYASFALCASNDNVDADTYRIASCTSQYLNENQTIEFAQCIGGQNISPELAQFLDCGAKTNYQVFTIATCTADGQLTDDQRRIYSCVVNNWGSYADMATCSAGDSISPDQRRILGCLPLQVAQVR